MSTVPEKKESLPDHPILSGYFLDGRLERLLAVVESLYREVSLPAHGMDHIRRVMINGAEIGREMNCRMDIVLPAILLHDIGFLEDPDPSNHHDRGARMCTRWLNEWNPEDRQAIADCIRNHKGETRGFGTRPRNPEQEVVCDADSLEKVGYIGILQGIRTLTEFGEGGFPEFRSLPAALRHLAELDDQTFYTERGRRLAEERGGVGLRRELYSSALEELDRYIP